MKEILNLETLKVSNLDERFLQEYKKHLIKCVDRLILEGKADMSISRRYIRNGLDLEDVTVHDIKMLYNNNEHKEIEGIILYTVIHDLQIEDDENKIYDKMIQYFNTDTVELILQAVYPEFICKKDGNT